MRSPGFTATVCVPRDHPCLPGHFPGQPLVPAVLLLDHVARALRAWRGERMTRVLEAKFVAPLAPEQTARIALEDAVPHVRFRIENEAGVIARGIVAGSVDTAAEEPA